MYKIIRRCLFKFPKKVRTEKHTRNAHTMQQDATRIRNVALIRKYEYCLNHQKNTRSAYTMPHDGVQRNFGPEYCLKLVKQNDHENFLCTLLLKERRDAFALRAFNVEVAKCNSNVSEDHIAKMRLKFWYDSIDKCFSDKKSYVSDHPVLQELKNTIDNNQLTKTYLKRMVNARDRGSNQQFSTIREMEQYSEQAYSSLLYLLAECREIKNVKVDHALSHLGKAQGIVTLLRAIPYQGRHQALNIPQELIIKHNVSQERILRHDPDDKAVTDCIFEIANVAFKHLEKARNLSVNVPYSASNILLPAIIVDRYLERLRKADFRLNNESCLRRDSLLPMALYWYNFRGKY